MNADSIFVTPGRPLLNEVGRAWLGLQRSSAPELNRAVVELFEQLGRKIGFTDNARGEKFQEIFNSFLGNQLEIKNNFQEIFLEIQGRQ